MLSVFTLMPGLLVLFSKLIDSILNRMALISTVARSRPMPKCMNARAARPLMVVSEEEEISGMALESAAMQASRTPSVSCSSLKRWHRMMA